MCDASSATYAKAWLEATLDVHVRCGRRCTMTRIKWPHAVAYLEAGAWRQPILTNAGCVPLGCLEVTVIWALHERHNCVLQCGFDILVWLNDLPAFLTAGTVMCECLAEQCHQGYKPRSSTPAGTEQVSS